MKVIQKILREIRTLKSQSLKNFCRRRPRPRPRHRPRRFL
jgi:hypothetical protein